ncbi:unnamed protein product [Lota lota]
MHSWARAVDWPAVSACVGLDLEAGLRLQHTGCSGGGGFTWRRRREVRMMRSSEMKSDGSRSSGDAFVLLRPERRSAGASALRRVKTGSWENSFSAP